MHRKSGLATFPVRGALMILMAVALASGCGVSKSKYIDVTKKSEDLTAQNQQLQAGLDSANKAKAQLEADNAALQSKVNEMEASTQQIQSQLQETQKSNDEMKQTYDTMVGHLQGELNSGKVEVQQMRDGISVNLAQDILFKSGSADLDKSGRELLLKVADQLKASNFQIIVTGHTDNQKIGPALASRYPTNWELGGARAARIVRLFEESGIAKDKLAALSFSDSRPRVPNDTPADRMKNRRIEIKLRPTDLEQTANQ